MAEYVPKKIELKPKRHHGYLVMLFIMGTLFPPMGASPISLLYTSLNYAKQPLLRDSALVKTFGSISC